MKFFSILAEIFTPQQRHKSSNDHEDFMKLMQWGCYNDVTQSRK